MNVQSAENKIYYVPVTSEWDVYERDSLREHLKKRWLVITSVLNLVKNDLEKVLKRI